MKLNIANPSTGAQKIIEIDDENQLRPFFDKRISAEVPGDVLGEEFKGYLFRINGGQDKQGVPMKQGVLTTERVRLLLTKGTVGFQGFGHRNGERRRKSIRGCIVSPEIAVLNVAIVKKGPGEVPGLTDKEIPRRLGPKRASKIRKLFNLSKADDVRKYVIRREIPGKDGKKGTSKAPKIQRLVTPVTLQRRRRRKALRTRQLEKSKQERETYKKLIDQRMKEQRKARREHIAHRREMRSKSQQQNQPE